MPYSGPAAGGGRPERGARGLRQGREEGVAVRVLEDGVDLADPATPGRAGPRGAVPRALFPKFLEQCRSNTDSWQDFVVQIVR